MGSKAAPPLAEHHSSPVMAASATATADDPFIPIYISSDEDDEVTVLGSSRSPEDMQIQQAILLSLDSSRDPTTIPSSSSASPFAAGTAGTGTSKESIPDRKGNPELRLGLPRFPMSSSSISLPKPKRHQVIDIDGDTLLRVIDLDGDDDSLIFIKEIGNGGRKKPRNGVHFEIGECSNSAKDFDCAICMETVPGVERFPIPGCGHAFCAGCVRQYIAARVEENLLAIGCPDPGCKDGVLHPEECRHVIPSPMFHRWGAALCDMALEEIKFYCPFKDCSALLVDDEPRPGEAKVECPHCKRMFCAKCKVPWHDGVDCAEFQRLGDDERGREDLLLRKVAQQSKWQRCPKCKIYVDRVDGCTFIACRCGHCFCYLCGNTMARNNHYCRNCNRTR